MSLAELFYAKNRTKHCTQFPRSFLRRGPRRHTLPPRRRKLFFEALEPRLLLSTTGLLHFLDAAGHPASFYEKSDPAVAVEVVDADLNTNPGTADTATVTLTSTTESAGGVMEPLLLTETGPATGIFHGAIPLGLDAAAAADGVLAAAVGDTLTLTYLDAADDFGNPVTAAQQAQVVAEINDAPQGTDKMVTTLEDSAYTFTATDFGFTDPNDTPANSFLAVEITTLPSAGSLTDSGINVTAGQFISLADLVAGQLIFTPAPNANGTGYAAFTFQVQDDGGTLNGGIDLDPTPNTLTLDVTPVNDAPSFLPGPDQTDLEDAGAQTVSGWATDITPGPADEAGQVLTFLVSTDNAALFAVAPALAPDGTLTYSPTPNAHGSATVTVVLQDGGGTANGGVDTSTPQSFTLTVTPVNDAPVAGDDAYTTLEDTPLTIPTPGILANDTDVEGDPLTAVLVDSPTHGTLGLNADGSFLYTPNLNYHGPDSFTYRATDGTADSNLATVALTITSVNDAPQGTDRTVTTLEDTPYTFATVDFGFSDPNDSPANTLLAVQITTLPGAGSLTDNGVAVTAGQLIPVADLTAGTLLFTPAAHANGTGYAAFTFQVQDDGGVANGGVDLDPTPNTLTLDVTPLNDAPVASADSAVTAEDTPVTLSVATLLANDTDVDGDLLTLPSVGNAVHGSVGLNGDGDPVFTPAPNFTGAASFEYTVSDGQGGSDTATVTITVTPVNDAPVAQADAYTTPEDTPLTIPTPGILANDADVEGDALTALMVDGPAHGTLTLNQDGYFTYTPALNFNGTDSFTYKANDGTADSDLATVALSVTPVNDAPAFFTQRVQVALDTSTLAPPAAQLAWDLVDGDGAVNNGVLLTGFTTDGILGEAFPWGGVTGALPGPVTLADRDLFNEYLQELTLGDSLAFTLHLTSNFAPDVYDNPLHDNLSFFILDPDSFPLVTTDLLGDALLTIDLDVAVTPAGLTELTEPPVPLDVTASAGPDQAVPEDAGPQTVSGWATAITAGPANEAGQALTFQVTGNTNPALFAAPPAIAPDGTLTYTPALNAHGQAQVTVLLRDDGGTGTGGVDTSLAETFTLTITSVNDAPVLTPIGNQGVAEETPLSFTVTATDPNDSPANALSLSVSALPAGASFDAATGLFSWTPTEAQQGSYLVTFTATDDGSPALSDAETLSITVAEINDAPQGTDRTVSALEDTPHTFKVADFGFTDLNDTPANSLLAVQITTLPTAGTLTDNGVTVIAGQFVSLADISSGKLVFTPTADANGTGYASFTFQVQDNGGTANGGTDLDPTPNTLTIDVTPVNDAPAFFTQRVQVTLDTSALATGAAQLAWDLIDGDFAVNNGVLLTDFTTDGILGEAFPWGGVTGALPGPVTLADRDFFNEYLQELTLGDSLAFTLHLTNNFSPDVYDNPLHDNLAFFILDDLTGLPLVTTDLLGDALLTIDLDVAVTPAGLTELTEPPVPLDVTASAGPDQAVPEDAGPQTVSGWATAITAGPANEAAQALTFQVAGNTNPALFGVQPALSPEGTLTYTPAPNANGQALVTVVLRDDGGTATGGVDTSLAQTFTLTVTPVNDAPQGTDRTVTTLEDTPYTFAAADFGFSDLNDSPANALLAVRITTLPGAGSLKDHGTTVTVGQLIPVADIVAGKLVFAPAAHANGMGYASFTFQVQDDGGVANSGVDLDPTPNTLTLDVTPVNDAPEGANYAGTTLEDTPYVLDAADFGFSDPNDSPANNQLAVRITTLPGAGSLSDNGVAVTAGQLIPVADIVAGKLVFTPTANANGAGYASFTFQVQDDGGVANGGIDLDPTPNTITVDVTPVNDAPAFFTQRVQVALDTSTLAPPAAQLAWDLVDGDGAVNNGVLLTDFTTDGILGGPASTWGGVTGALPGPVTLADRDFFNEYLQGVTLGDTLAFTLYLTSNFAGGVPDNLGFFILDPDSFPLVTTDLLGDALLTIDLDVAVTPAGLTELTEPPVPLDVTASAGPDQAVPEDAGPQVVPGWATAITAGPPDEAGQALTFQVTGNTNPALFAALPAIAPDGTLTYTAAPNANGQAQVTVLLRDDGGTGTGGVDTSLTQTFTLTVTSVNDTPMNTAPGPQTVNEDTALVFSDTNGNPISITDIDAGNQPVQVTLTATNGLVTLGGMAALTFTLGDGTADATLTFSGTFPAINTALEGLRFQPLANFNGPASLQVATTDQGNTGAGGPLSDTDTIPITVTPVNDAPQGADTMGTTLEDTAYTLDAADFGITDPNDSPANTLLAVKITTFPGAGSLTFNGTPMTAGQFITVSDITAGKLVFTPAANANGPAYAAFTFQVQDDGGVANGGADLDPTPNTITIDVTPVNDAPVAGNDTYSLDQYTSLGVPASQGVLANDGDVDGDLLQALLVSGPAHGILTWNPDGSFTYTPNPKFLGTDSFTYKANDGQADSNSATVILTVNPVVINVDSLVRVSYSGYMFNRSTNTFDTVATITNTSPDSLLLSPMSLVVTSITPTSVTLFNPTGQTADFKPYLAVPLPEAGLAPGQSISGILLKFTNLLRTRFTFTSSVLAVDPFAEGAAPADLLASADSASPIEALGWFPGSDDAKPPRRPEALGRMALQGSRQDSVEAGLLGRSHASGSVPPLIDWLGSSTPAEATGWRGAAPALFRPASPWLRPFLLERAATEDAVDPNSEIRLVIAPAMELEPRLGSRG